MTEVRVLFFAVTEDDSCSAWFDRWINAKTLNQDILAICKENGCDYSITTTTRQSPH